MQSGRLRFTIDDLFDLQESVAASWLASEHLDWSSPAGTLTWTCLATADHAVDCVYAPAFFLASRRTDRYPQVGLDLTLGVQATPALLVESLQIATHLLTGAVRNADPDTRAVIFGPPHLHTAAPDDFVPRAALELALHAHDVGRGLGRPLELAPAAAERLREHTRPWPIWNLVWDELPETDDPWGDLLTGSGRHR